MEIKIYPALIFLPKTTVILNSCDDQIILKIKFNNIFKKSSSNDQIFH